jgi:hypothetical protein
LLLKAKVPQLAVLAVMLLAMAASLITEAEIGKCVCIIGGKDAVLRARSAILPDFRTD